MTSLILADSDAQRRNELISSLQRLRPDWQIHGCANGNEALNHTHSHAIDCLISDSELTDMNATELLTGVKQTAPQVIRIIVCADENHEIVMQSANASHRFIDRRVGNAAFIDAIENSLSLNRILDSEHLHEYINQSTRLPSVPVIYQEMMDALAAPNGSLSKVAELVEADVGLSSTILNIVNSAYYGLAQRVDSIAQCVALLGVHLIKNITLTTSVFSQFKEFDLDLDELARINNHALRTGALCNHFARVIKAPKKIVDQAQIAGMMGNTGELLFLCTPSLNEETASQVEQEHLGALLLRSWNMPDAIVEAVAQQYKGPGFQDNSNQTLIILHSLRYLERNLNNFQCMEEIELCAEHLAQWTNNKIARQWLDAYVDFCSLNPNNPQEQRCAA